VTAGAYMLLLGLGIGFMIQIVVLAAQNSVARRDLGVATSSINFFRSIGGSIGTAVVGSLFAARLASELTGVPGADELDVATITPESVTALPTELGEHLVDAVSNAFTHSLLYLVPFLAAGFVLALALRELPLQGSEPAPPGAGSAQGGEDVGGEQLEVPVDQVVGHAGDARPQVDVLDR
jgi:hypothetical protein